MEKESDECIVEKDSEGRKKGKRRSRSNKEAGKKRVWKGVAKRQ